VYLLGDEGQEIMELVSNIISPQSHLECFIASYTFVDTYSPRIVHTGSMRSSKLSCRSTKAREEVETRKIGRNET
jgi:hypothetical protein